jgi:hypothetical protein
MSTTQLQITKVKQGTPNPSIQLDERIRDKLFRSQVPIAPRPFVYDTLQPGEIRLIDISPSQDRSTPIQVALRHQPLRYGTYEALSHAWKTETRAKVHVNGKLLTVSDSLLEALRDIRRETANRTLWIDSICVDRNNREECEQPLVSEILHYATGILSWSWNDDTKRGALYSTVYNPWPIFSGRSSPPTLDSIRPDAGVTEGEKSILGKEWQAYFDSPPALTPTPGSPQTESTSPSLGSSADSLFHATPVGSFEIEWGYSATWAPTVYDSGFPQPQSACETTLDISNTSQRKRSRVAAFPDDQRAQCNRKTKHTQSTGTENHDRGAGVVFACPFQKSNPQKYHRCLKYTLNRIKDVKQHIYRQHSQPAYYCARCYQIFTSTEDRDGHSRRADCEKRDPPQFEGISEQQRNELRKSSPKKKPLDEQWYEVWDVVFPQCQRPQSPFIGNHVEEVVSLLRSFWNERKAEIISRELGTKKGCEGVNGDMVADIMGSVFDRFEAETSRSTEGGITEKASPETPSAPEVTTVKPDFRFDFEGIFNQQNIAHLTVPGFEDGCAVDFGNYYYSQDV